MFSELPSYSRYRTLRLTDPEMSGEDCFALQTAIKAIGIDPGPLDGVLGPECSAAIKVAQRHLEITVDGFAGGGTQEALGRRLQNKIHNEFKLADGLMRGQLEHESSWRLGNYSPPRPDGSYDAGIAQRNTAHTPAKQGFDVPVAIRALALNTRQHYDLFLGVPSRRRWALAAGAWNAPAYACWIANQEGAKVPRANTAQPGPTARATLEQYIVSVTTYLKTD